MGRQIGAGKREKHAATELNRKINKVNLLIHSHYSEILKRTGKVTALEVKNAFQGIASTQKTLLVLFDEIMQEFHSRVGLDLPFVESFDFHLRIEQKMKPASVNGVIIQLLSAAKVAVHRNYISRPPFFGYKLERPEFQIRSLTAGELESLISTEIQLPDVCFVRDMFVFACFTGIFYIDLKNPKWKEIITEVR